MGIRLTTWNVNGIRNPFAYQPWRDRRSFQGMFDLLEADVIVMQELKIQAKDLTDDMVLVPGWDCYFSLPRRKKGYSGVGIYTRQSVCGPTHAEEGLLGVLCPPGSSTPYRDLPQTDCIGGYLTDDQLAELDVEPPQLDSEGRCVALQFPAFVLFGLYSPANCSGMRDDFRHAFMKALDWRVRNLSAMGKRVVVMGDLNVSSAPIDSAGALEETKKSGAAFDEYVSTPNRRLFNRLLENGAKTANGDGADDAADPVMWDSCRAFHPARKGMYTHWEQKINARPANYGSRIDYVLCGLSMKSWVSEADIQEGLMGSDHCPVYAVLRDRVDLDGRSVHLLDLMNPSGVFADGKRVRALCARDLPSLCGRLLPEFDRRRSIKDMFVRRQEPALTAAAGLVDNGKAPVQPASDGRLDRHEKLHKPREIEKLAATRKRQTPDSSPGHRKPEKRANNGTRDSPAKKGGTGGQRTLKVFFGSKEPGLDQKEADDYGKSKFAETAATAASDPETRQVAEADMKVAPETETETKTETKTGTETEIKTQAQTGQSNAGLSQTLWDEQTSLIDPIESKESWAKLFTKPATPRCSSHQEPCTLYTTKKSGFNQGRAFWLCPRPVGPTGSKEQGTEWRCHTFIWSSDWPNKAS